MIELVEGPYRLSRCVRGDSFCPRMPGPAGFSAVYAEIADAVREKLESYTFARLCAESAGEKIKACGFSANLLPKAFLCAEKKKKSSRSLRTGAFSALFRF